MILTDNKGRGLQCIIMQHDDIKPHNLCLLDNRSILLDLGSARKLIPDETTEPISRTPGYAAPELEEGACAAPWIDVFGMTATLKEILSPKAKRVYSPAIIDGMDPQRNTRLKTPAAFCAAIHACYENDRKQKWQARLIRLATHAAVAGIAIVATLWIAADRKKHHSDDALNGLTACEVLSLAHLQQGKIDFANTNTLQAIESFRRAKECGERATRILRLIEP